MKEIKPYHGESPFSCGPASLLIAYRTLGIEYNEVSLTLELGTTKEGTGWNQMFSHVAEVTRFPVELKSGSSYEDLKKDFKKGVIIVGWFTDTNTELDPHFSVVSGILDDLIELTDPGLPGEYWPSIMTKEEFMNKWFEEQSQGTYLLIKPKKN